MVKVLASKNLYKGKILDVYIDDIESDGKEMKREYIRHNGGAGILCEKDGKFVFVRQYRHPFKEVFFEIPAGMREKGEDGKVTAIRELEEECALKAENITFISEYAVSPGYSSENIFLYYVDKTSPSKQHLDEDEQLEIVWLDKKEAFDMAKNGKIKDGKTLTALYWYMAVKENNL